ncbi:iron-sulfur cluster carrier protein ApbC [Pseudomaricurvus alkylphenolicus]|uniref:iron-sulfur cluster carrier protein ApbC n=1 Tax=Pseudomaricurvus alkylphenolicus TaxID=1306991 RepID=UPI001421CA68|nr:iron-sulfur cluster carrier protein ApbC [Pseudomaricurvus alkylphenolicus]NIB41924.1 iron-sulfur cluster carrier protein ApbC [Pseudomaricurvus alkylphenolicus]
MSNEQSPSSADLQSRVLNVPVPGLDVSLAQIAEIESLVVEGGRIGIALLLGIPGEGLQQSLSEAIWQSLKGLPGVEEISVDVGWRILPGPVADQASAISNVKNIIAVASGKGGVGKSTTAVNLALALAAEGADVGILDADIYGPSVPAMLGVGDKRPEVIDQKAMVPVAAHGLHSISMGYLVTEQTPMVWRGPMASGALQQLLTQTAWPELDYLIIDMPPGTGDIQLTLSQKVPVTASVVVTTPQDIALLDAKKGVEMFRKVHVPVLGVVENMAIHICSNCGHEEHIFGEGGGERIAREYQTRLLGSLPLNLTIRQQADEGRPTVAADPDAELSLRYRQIARQLTVELLQLNASSTAPVIEISDD